ncbi:hypothetical protein EPO14_01135 [Patescibacteria group bacterium]|nr:MAG: hypothetical protein EPO14_01135 [Patescibacteria group bacterium]
MAKTAQQVSTKFAERAANATGEYVEGAKTTDKDQSAAAIAAKDVYRTALAESFTRGSYEKGLQKSGKVGWLKGVEDKGAVRFGEGARASADKYATESGRYDGARQAARSLPRGVKGSEANFARSKAVGKALRDLKVGSSK